MIIAGYAGVGMGAWAPDVWDIWHLIASSGRTAYLKQYVYRACDGYAINLERAPLITWLPNDEAEQRCTECLGVQAKG